MLACLLRWPREKRGAGKGKKEGGKEGGKDVFVRESVFLCADPRAARPSLRECVLFVL